MFTGVNQEALFIVPFPLVKQSRQSAPVSLYLLLAVMFGVGKIVALVLVLPFLLGPLGWVVFLRHNKPEGYAEDWFDQTFSGAGFTLASHMQPAPVVRSRNESGT